MCCITVSYRIRRAHEWHTWYVLPRHIYIVPFCPLHLDHYILYYWLKIMPKIFTMRVCGFTMSGWGNVVRREAEPRQPMTRLWTPNWWCGDKNPVRAQPWVMNWKPGARWAADTLSLVSQQLVLCSAPSVPQSVFTITEKAPTRAFSGWSWKHLSVIVNFAD